MTTALHSIAIFVHNLERARTFYETQLGLPVARAGSFGLELLDVPPHVGVHPAGHSEAKAMVGRHTGLTFHVVGLLAACERMAAAGVTFITPPTQQEFGIMAMVADPDGNIMALWEDNTAEVEGES